MPNEPRNRPRRLLFVLLHLHHLPMPLAPLLHDLALLYLALAHGADDQFDHREQATIREQLHTWAPGADPALCDHALREATLSYGNGVTSERLHALLDRLRGALDEQGRARVLTDLADLAAADSVIEEGETALIEQVQRAWA